MEIIEAKDDAYNRKILEQKRGIVIVGLEHSQGKDKPKQLASGLNGILARIAAKNNNFIGIDLTKLRNADKAKRARLLARISQNVEFCKKAGARLGIHGSSTQDFRGLIESLGGSSAQASKAISF